ncbi:MAG: hypothetical protein J6M18_00620 [Actinomycetaceae bacterium]|nr:hypothetical protein [Actinomycetaceae bacterium]
MKILSVLQYKKVLAGVTGLAFVVSGVGVASAVSADETSPEQMVSASASGSVYGGKSDSSQVVSTERLENIGQVLENVEATDTTARDMVAELLGGSAQASKELASLVDPSLDVSDEAVEQPSTPAKKLEETLNTDGVGLLPEVNETGEVSIKDVETGGEFSLAPAGAQAETVEDGVAVTRSNVGASVSHVDGDLEGQIVTVINSENVNHADFTFDIPVDHHLRYGTDGKLDLVNNQGDTVATVDAPWAVDATGQQHLPTYYELIPASSTIRQHVDTKGATYPIAIDPSWWWWTATATTCGIEVGALMATGGVAAAAYISKIVAKINKATKIKKVADAVKQAGGAKEYAKLLAKRAYGIIYDKSPNWIKKLIKRPAKLTWNQILIADTISLSWDIIADLAGFGSCVSLVRGN